MLRGRACVFFCTSFAPDRASLESLDLTGRGRRVLIRLSVVCGTRLRMPPLGVQSPEARWAFRHDAGPSLPGPVDGSLVPCGLPQPTLQVHVVLAAGPRVSTDEAACCPAGHHPRHVGGTRGVEAGALLVQACARRRPRRGRTVRRCQRGRATLALWPVRMDALVCRLYIGHAAVDTGGQALAGGVRAAPPVGIQGALERSTDVSSGRRPAASRRW
jgi:hypothetical protein